jgi:hypothetical protein
MRGFLWLCAWVAVAVWSIVALLTYGLLDAAGELAMRNADAFSADPETVEWIWRVFSWLHGLSTSIALVIWGVVALAILSVPWLFDRLLGKGTVVRTPAPYGRPMAPQPGPSDGVIDLGPDQYRVEPESGHSGSGSSVPRVAPRR